MKSHTPTQRTPANTDGSFDFLRDGVAKLIHKEPVGPRQEAMHAAQGFIKVFDQVFTPKAQTQSEKLAAPTGAYRQLLERIPELIQKNDAKSAIAYMDRVERDVVIKAEAKYPDHPATQKLLGATDALKIGLERFAEHLKDLQANPHNGAQYGVMSKDALQRQAEDRKASNGLTLGML